jgi:protein TonB
MPERAPKQARAHRFCSPALLALSAVALSWLSGCSTPTTQPVTRPAQEPSTPHTAGAKQTEPLARAGTPTVPPGLGTSAARTPRDYRKDAASHLYARHSQHIYKGRLPPMLEAVGVLNVDIDRHGSVKSLQWMRAPRHVPQVMQQIERMVRAAAPYPVPQHMQQVTYTDVWLWHKSGKFQLDTLTEGQD